MSSLPLITYFLAAGYFASVLAAVLRPSLIVLGISGPGYTMAAPGPGLVPAASTLPQSCAAWRTKGSGLAQPLILAAIERMRSVAEAPTPPQSSQALRYPGGRAGSPACAETAKFWSLSTLPSYRGCRSCAAWLRTSAMATRSAMACFIANYAGEVGRKCNARGLK